VVDEIQIRLVPRRGCKDAERTWGDRGLTGRLEESPDDSQPDKGVLGYVIL
jgi:hypothetical protein